MHIVYKEQRHLQTLINAICEAGFNSSLTVFCACSLFSQSGQGAGQPFGQQGVYNNMSITVSMAGGSSGVSSLPPIGQSVGMSNSNLSNVGSVCSDQQVSDFEPASLDSCDSFMSQ